MKLKITKSFKDKLNDQVEFIALDKPAAARKFKSQLLLEIRSIPKMPYRFRKSIFFDRGKATLGLTAHNTIIKSLVLTKIMQKPGTTRG